MNHPSKPSNHLQDIPQIPNPEIYLVVAIQNYGSSGTLFIQSLLDNHPQILSIPALFYPD